MHGRLLSPQKIANLNSKCIMYMPSICWLEINNNSRHEST